MIVTETSGGLTVPSITHPWICRQIRVTTFHANLRQATEGLLIQPVFGIDPEAIEIRPQSFVRSETAQMGPGRLTGSSAMNRVDWVWQEPESLEDGVGLGAPWEVFESFIPRVKQWLGSQVDVNRVALGGQFGIKVASREDGYRKLDELIAELSFDPNTTSDVMYQVNRPVLKDVCGEEIRINRVEKWSCRQMISGAFSLSGTTPGHAQNVSEVVGVYATCELDINSDKDNAVPFGGEKSVALLDQLSLCYKKFFDGE